MQKTFTLVSKSLKINKNKHLKPSLIDDMEPSDSLIQNILNYSKSLKVKKSNSIGYIEMIAS